MKTRTTDGSAEGPSAATLGGVAASQFAALNYSLSPILPADCVAAHFNHPQVGEGVRS